MEYSKERWRALGFLTMGAFLSPLDYFIVNIALPAIRSDFNASNASLQMVIAAYGLTYAALVVCGGRFGDIFGRKKMFIIGLYVFMIASAGCAFSPTIYFLIGFRILQGVGAAMLAPQALANIRVIFPSTEQIKAIGIFGSVFGFAAIMGQLLGGILLKLQLFGFTWQSVFLINIPVAVICIIGVSKVLQETRSEKKTNIDFIGILLIIGALLCVIYPLIEGNNSDWPIWIFMMIILGLLFFYIFIKYESRLERSGKTPLIYTGLLKNKTFSLGLCIILIYNFTAGLFICYPFYLQKYLLWSSLDTGLAILPYGIGFFVAPLISTKINASSISLTKAGLLLLIIGIFLSAFMFYWDAEPGLCVYLALLIAGSGHGTVMPAMLKNVMSDIAANEAGQASGVVSTAIQIGSVLGGAVIGSLFFSIAETTQMSDAIVIALSAIGGFQILGLIIAFNYSKQHKKKWIKKI
ncbi:MFS transporter [Chryseobacterium sp. ISL-6]|uniref:MFS transporter n=1 Tax=Chryseobacterium sp. ISL-6 TaxID=2819143 RepID=UPI001BE4F0ED|nr:MFS transporter [Chryseobacterium sp. ISL-6]MBT2622234.1 MFS transporter [Chryseobacterium sp. ISL-6]